jgi:hypothetical protein
MDASPYAVSMSNDSALASHWFWFFCDGKPDDYGRTSNGENPIARLSWHRIDLPAGKRV